MGAGGTCRRMPGMLGAGCGGVGRMGAMGGGRYVGVWRAAIETAKVLGVGAEEEMVEAVELKSMKSGGGKGNVEDSGRAGAERRTGFRLASRISLGLGFYTVDYSVESRNTCVHPL